RRYAVGFVVETLGKQFGQVLDRNRAKQLRMNCRDTVGAMRTNDSKVGHSNLALSTLFHETYALNPSLISGETLSNFITQAAINFVDDLQVTWEHSLKPDERPLLKSFGQ